MIPVSDCERFVVIRYYKPGDEAQCRKLVYYGTMSTVRAAFISALTREITLQVVVVLMAVMFIFLGLSPTACLLSLPATVMIVFVAVYLAHFIKAQAMTEDILHIPRHYMSSDYSGFWVAEAFESTGSSLTSWSQPLLIIREGSQKHLEGNYHRKLVGTAAIIRSPTESNCAWMRRVAVDPTWQKHGIASALIDEIISCCRDKGFEMITLVTTECHEGARALYAKKGFHLRQLYHKQIFSNIVQILMYEYTYTLDEASALA